MKAPVVLEALCEQLREAQLEGWTARVTQLYHLTYREAYAAGQGDCEERWADLQEEDDDEQRRS
jgi:hypothetical protein